MSEASRSLLDVALLIGTGEGWRPQCERFCQALSDLPEIGEVVLWPPGRPTPESAVRCAAGRPVEWTTVEGPTIPEAAGAVARPSPLGKEAQERLFGDVTDQALACSLVDNGSLVVRLAAACSEQWGFDLCRVAWRHGLELNRAAGKSEAPSSELFGPDEGQDRSLERFYRQVLDAMPAQLAVFDKEARYQYVTPSAIRNADTRAWIIGKTDLEFCERRGLDPEIGMTRQLVLLDVARERSQRQFQESFPDREGSLRHFVRFVTPVFDESGEVVSVLGYGLDITDVRRVEEELRVSRAEYQQLVEEANDLIYRIDEDGRFTYANPVALRTTGMEPDELEKLHFTDLVAPGHQSEVSQFYVDQVSSGTRNSYYEFPILGADGQELWLGQNVQLLFEGDEFLGAHAVARDISDRRHVEEALRSSESRTRAVVESALDCVITIDGDGRVLEFNPAAEKTFGHRREDVLGAMLSEILIPEDLREAHVKGMAHYHATGEGPVLGKRIEVPALRSDGSVIPVELAITPHTLEDGSQAFTAYLRDITERRENEAALREAKSQAEASGRAKESFLANMSHEIRTPLNAVIGMAHLLERTELDSRQLEYLSAIRYSADTLLALISDILDFSKIESGYVELESIPFRPGEVIRGVADALRFEADRKGLRLEVEGADGLPATVAGDPVRLNQVLLNLIGNALKFTERGEVRIRVSGENPGPLGDTHLVFEVDDTGVGIPEDQLEVIFEPFEQARADETRRFGGTGLGLPIVKRLVEQQGGSISVRSTVGAGSVFRVTLPYAVVSDEALAVVEDERELDERLDGIRLLLVEDNELNQRVASELLRQAGAVVHVADNGLAAVEVLRDRRYDVVLMDIQMPLMDGYQAAREIRGQLDLPAEELPILALTASALVEERDKAIAAGMDDFLIKPFHPDHLRRRIAFWAHRARKGGGPRADATTPSGPAPDASSWSFEVESTAYHVASGPIDFAGLHERTLGDAPFAREIVDFFLQHTPSDLEDIRSSLDAEDWQHLQACAHRLKSSAGMVGATALQAGLEQVEVLASEGAAPWIIARAVAPLQALWSQVEPALQKYLHEPGPNSVDT